MRRAPPAAARRRAAPPGLRHLPRRRPQVRAGACGRRGRLRQGGPVTPSPCPITPPPSPQYPLPLLVPITLSPASSPFSSPPSPLPLVHPSPIILPLSPSSAPHELSSCYPSGPYPPPFPPMTSSLSPSHSAPYHPCCSLLLPPCPISSPLSPPPVSVGEGSIHRGRRCRSHCSGLRLKRGFLPVPPQGLVDTARKNFGGGNTAWEERALSKYESR